MKFDGKRHASVISYYEVRNSDSVQGRHTVQRNNEGYRNYYAKNNC